MSTTTKVRHRVTDVDSEARTGTCSVCGSVEVYKGSLYRGVRYWRCGDYGRAYANQRLRSDPSVEQRLRNSRFQRLYGITVEQYDEMLEAQGFTCARCDKSQETMRLAVDHCHETGRVRGLLCGPCNTYLGRLEARLGILAEDLAYIGGPVAQPISERLVTEPVSDW